MRTCATVLAVIGGSTGLCRVAFAQDVSTAPTIGTAFDRTRTTAVAATVVPGYEPVGIKFGQTVLFPEIDAGSFAVDNLYVQDVDRQADLALVISPSASLVSQTANNHLVVQGGATRTWFVSHGTENSSLYRGSVQERYNFSNELTGYVYGGFQQSLVSRTDPGSISGLSRPLVVSSPSAGAQLTWTRNRLRLAAEGTYRRSRFSDLYYRSGLVASPQGLDRHQDAATLTAEYALTSDFALLAQAKLEHIDYEDVSTDSLLDKSSVKHEFLVGASFEFTDFIRGEFALGYINQNYSSPLYKDFSGFGGRVRVQFFPTRLTTVELNLSRTVQEAASVLDSSYIASTASLKLDHALFRNVTLSPSVAYSRNSFAQVGRTDKQFRTNFAVMWMLDRNFSLQGQYQFVHADTNSSVIGRNFTANQFSITLSYKY